MTLYRMTAHGWTRVRPWWREHLLRPAGRTRYEIREAGLFFLLPDGRVILWLSWETMVDMAWAEPIRGLALVNAVLDAKAPGMRSLRELGW